MRTKEDQKILEQLKELAKVPNMLGLRHYEDENYSYWWTKNGENRLNIKMGDGAAIEYYKIFKLKMIEVVEKPAYKELEVKKLVPNSGFMEQMKNGKAEPLKGEGYSRAKIIKILENLWK